MLASGETDYMDRIRALAVLPGDKMLSSVVVESEPGDVIPFAMPLLHASFGGCPGRRLGATVYWYPSATPAQLEARRREVRAIRGNHERMFEFPADEPYCHPDFIAGARGKKRGPFPLVAATQEPGMDRGDTLRFRPLCRQVPDDPECAPQQHDRRAVNHQDARGAIQPNRRQRC